MTDDPRIAALPDIHGHAKGEHKPFAEERPIPYTARMLFLWFFHACRRASPRFLMVADHMNYLTFEDPAAVNLVRRALKLAQAGDLYGAAETAGVELGHAAAVSDGLRKGMRYSIGAEVDNDPRCRPDAQNIVDAMRPDGMVRSVHFLPIAHPQHGENWMWPFDNPEFKDLFETVGTERTWEIYMTVLLDAIEKLPGNIVGHFYVPAKFGHWPDDATLEGYEDRLLDACAQRGLAVEVNSRYFYKFYAGDDEQIERYRAAHLRLLRKAKERGVMIAVGSDAHSPKDQGAAFDSVLALLDEAGINEIAFPIAGRLARVALRATDEILRQHAAALAAPVASPARPGEPSFDDGVDGDEDEAPAAAERQPLPVAETVAVAAIGVPGALAAAAVSIGQARRRRAKASADGAQNGTPAEAGVQVAGESPTAGDAGSGSAVTEPDAGVPDAAAVAAVDGPESDAERPGAGAAVPEVDDELVPVSPAPIAAAEPSLEPVDVAEKPGERPRRPRAARPSRHPSQAVVAPASSQRPGPGELAEALEPSGAAAHARPPETVERKPVKDAAPPASRARPVRKAAASSVSAAKPARAKRAAPAKKAVAAKKSASKAAAKKSRTTKPATKPFAKSRPHAPAAKKKSTAAKSGAKVSKRAVGTKRPVAKKSIAKKGTAKKKKSRR